MPYKEICDKLAVELLDLILHEYIANPVIIDKEKCLQVVSQLLQDNFQE